MKQRKKPHPQTPPPLSPLTSTRDAPEDDPRPLITVHDPEYALDLAKDIGTILSGYHPCDPGELEIEAVQGIGFFLEHLAGAGKKSLFHGERGEG